MGSGGRVLKVEWWYCQTNFFGYLLCRRMNSADGNDLMPAPAQEKLEWVTPKISLMDAGDTASGVFLSKNEALNGLAIS